MDEPLLSTKSFIPSVPRDWVRRPRLSEKIKSGLSYRLTLVSAPAGYGKTTLLCEVLNDTQMELAWLSLDHNDNDPTKFWMYFITALQNLYPDFGKSVFSMFSSPQALPLEWVEATLINEIANIPKEFVFVLDDYHVLENQSIHDSISHLIERMPSHMHLFIATRADPPISLAHLRARGYLNELRASDLSFTTDEAKEFLNDVMKLGISQENVDILETRSEGWIAGLRIAALTIQNATDVPNIINSFSGETRHIFDYLKEEVIERQSPEDKEFLLRTCVLERLTGSLCDFVTGRDDGQVTLERLDAQNLFVVPLDDKRQWYRYHQLFSDILRAQFTKVKPELFRDSHLRASIWFEDRGLITEATNHAIESQDAGRVVKILEPAALRMITQNRYATVSEWLSRLPNKFIDEHPWLCVMGAWASLTMQRYDTVQSFLQRAETRISEDDLDSQADPAELSRVRGHLLTIRALLAIGSGDFAEAITFGHKALKYMPADDIMIGSTVMATLGMAFVADGDLQSGYIHFKEAAARAKATDNYFMAIGAMGHMADLEAQMGHLNQAADTYRQALQLAKEWGHSVYPPIASYVFIGLSDVLYEQNKLDEASSLLEQGLRLAELSGESETIEKGYLSLARLKYAHGQIDAAHNAITKASELTSIPFYLNTSHIHASVWEARIWLMEGKLSEACEWAANEESQLNVKELPESRNEFAYLNWIRVKIACGELQGIPELLDHVYEQFNSEGKTGRVIEVLLLQALTFQALGRNEDAVEALSLALTIAEPEGYERIFLDEGELLLKLLQQTAAKAKGSRLNYITKLLIAFGETAEYDKSPDQSNLIKTLTSRELEVLRLIAAGLSNRAVAEVLVVTEGTIKKHLNNIFDKLDVGSRTHAVARAKELNII